MRDMAMAAAVISHVSTVAHKQGLQSRIRFCPCAGRTAAATRLATEPIAFGNRLLPAILFRWQAAAVSLPLTNVPVMPAAADAKPSLLLSILRHKCPRCRRGNMFQEANPYKLKSFMRMNERCPVCGQPLEMEPGFYYGTNMVSYALAVLFTALSFVCWWLTLGFSTKDNRFFWWMGINAVLLVLLQPPLMRLSRAVWIVFFVPYSSRWREGDIVNPERVNKEQAGNW